MNYSGINFCDTANGQGVRVSLFVSGCSLHCKGCFNKEAWDKNYGKVFHKTDLNKICKALANPYIDGLSILGGDPLEPYNKDVVCLIVKYVKELYPEKTIWLWTGRKYEDVKNEEALKYVDVVVDGPFIERKKVNEQGNWFGSSNQRVIRIHESNEGNVQNCSPE